MALIKLLPATHYRVLEEDMFSKEQHHIQACLIQIQQGDYSEFED